MALCWTGMLRKIASRPQQIRQDRCFSVGPSIGNSQHYYFGMRLFSSASDASLLTDEEYTMINDLYIQAAGDEAKLQELVKGAMPTMHPRMVVKLRQQQQQQSEGDDDAAFQAVSAAFQSVLDEGLSIGKQTLKTLMESGEIRKLDAEIGRAARTGKLDMAFFTVLNMNMADAAAAQQQQQSENEEANRLQILQHIYTRCQEELEKQIDPGTALLNKLLRTDNASIRKNQLTHYLCPQPTTITSPDGKEIQLQGGQPTILVPPSQLVTAFSQAVKQIRTIEQAGGTDVESAAGIVESMRQVAIEARFVIGENYGVESTELREFEDALMPVFRPDSAESPYIQGD